MNGISARQPRFLGPCISQRSDLHPAAGSDPTLLTLAIALLGAVAFRLLPVSPLPQVDFPTISVQDLRTVGLAKGRPAVILRQPGANIIETVYQVKAMLPQLRAYWSAGDPCLTLILAWGRFPPGRPKSEPQEAVSDEATQNVGVPQ